MTALSADAVIPYKADGSLVIESFPVADNVKIWKGALVCVDTSGYANVGADTASFRFAGVAVEQGDNTLTGHTAGGIRVRIRCGCRFLLPSTGLSQASVGAQVKVTDSGAVATASTNNVNVGRITEYISATSAWVFAPALGSAAGS
jgi:hypothetical protein